MRDCVREMLPVLAIAACAAAVLLPFHEQELRPWLWAGAGLAATAGLAGAIVTSLTKHGRSAAAMVGGMSARFLTAIAGLCACFLLLPRALTPVAMVLLPAYLAMLAREIVRAHRQARPAAAHRP